MRMTELVCANVFGLNASNNPISSCAVKGAGQQWVQIPPGNWIAPPGSNRSSGGSNEAAEASGVEGREGDLASMQAVM
jgi:hypothetical protein